MDGLRALSTINVGLARAFLAFKAGLQYLGKRDLYAVFGYPRVLMPQDLIAKYERQDIATRIVNLPADDTWAYPPKVTANPTFNKAWEKLVRDFNVWPILLQADKLCAFGRYSAVFLGLPGKSDTTARGGELMYLSAYSEASCEVVSLETNPQEPNFGRPLTYNISAGDPIGQSQKSTPIRVHASRLVHVVDSPLQGTVIGVPRMQIVYNLLEDLLKIAGGSAETYWLTANRGMQVDVDKEMTLTTADADALSDELDEYQHQLRRYIRTRGVKINPLGSDMADPRGVFEVLISLLAGTTGIPQRILMGSEAGQLASEQDRANWAEFIQRRRVLFAQPYVLLPFIKRLIELGILPKANEEIKFEWPEAFHQSPLEMSQTMAQTARAVVNLSRQTQMNFPLVSQEEAREICGLPEKPTVGKIPEITEKPAETTGNSGDLPKKGEDTQSTEKSSRAQSAGP